MLQICGGRGTGKTKLLLEKAKQENAIIVCREPIELREHAYLYGITGLNLMSYREFFDYDKNENPIYIYDLHDFLKECNCNIKGYRAQWK